MELVRSTWLPRTESAALVSKRDAILLTIRRTMTVPGCADKMVRPSTGDREVLSRGGRAGNMKSERCSRLRAPFVTVTIVHLAGRSSWKKNSDCHAAIGAV
jgi:hypothetical protein